MRRSVKKAQAPKQPTAQKAQGQRVVQQQPPQPDRNQQNPMAPRHIAQINNPNGFGGGPQRVHPIHRVPGAPPPQPNQAPDAAMGGPQNAPNMAPPQRVHPIHYEPRPGQAGTPDRGGFDPRGMPGRQPLPFPPRQPGTPPPADPRGGYTSPGWPQQPTGGRTGTMPTELVPGRGGLQPGNMPNEFTPQPERVYGPVQASPPPGGIQPYAPQQPERVIGPHYVGPGQSPGGAAPFPQAGVAPQTPSGQTPAPQPSWVDTWQEQAMWEAQQGIAQGSGQQAGGQTPGASANNLTTMPSGQPYPPASPIGSPQGSLSASSPTSSSPVPSGAAGMGNSPQTSFGAGSASSGSTGAVQGAGSAPLAPGAAGAGTAPQGVPASSGSVLNPATTQALTEAGITPAGQPNRFDPQVLGLPNSPQFIRAEAMLMDELSRTLMEIGVAREEIPAAVAQFKSRFETDTGLRTQQTNQAMADRGLMGSSIAHRAEFEAQIPEGRRWRDYLTGVEGMYGDLAQQELGAKLGYRRGMEELLYDHAQGLYDAPPSSVYSGNVDYYDQGGGTQPFFDPNAPGGYLEQYRWYEQPTQPEWYDPRDWMRPDYWGTVTPSGPGR